MDLAVCASNFKSALEDLILLFLSTACGNQDYAFLTEVVKPKYVLS